ncbi:MAG: SIS domain-containing protein [Lachnospiraceae bacterium]|nr:SIS domain-containing protein [Lachnospiraceae bacterium]
MDYLKELTDVLGEVEITEKGDDTAFSYDEGMEHIVNVFLRHRKEKSAVFFIGNGGSAAIACHMTADFLKNGRMHTTSLYNASVLTCLGNDYSYEDVFSKQLEMQMNKGDLLVAISSSGNSQNIIRAIDMAENLGGEVITLTGFKEDNAARKRGVINVYVPCEEYGIVESIHNLILQQVVDIIMEKDNG